MVVREWPASGVQTDTAVDEGVRLTTLVRLDIGELRYAIDLQHVAAVMEMATMTALPEPDGVWVGTIPSNRGDIQVASGAAVFGSGDGAAGPGSRIVVLRGRTPLALVVDQVLSSRIIDPEEFCRFSDVLDAGRRLLVNAIVWGEDGGVEYMLDPNALVNNLLARDISQDAEEHVPADALRIAEIARRYAAADGGQVLEVSLAGSEKRWALPVGVIRHVANSPQPQTLPRAPHGVTGLLSWRRRPIPVIDPAFVLESRLQGDAANKVVVIGPPVTGGATEDADCALLIDDVVGLRSGLPSGDGLLYDPSGETIRLIDIADMLAVF